ncbi:arginase family protein [Nonomuraea cavernae]|uniref:Arginase n=1 Tax=Nonomuraea cavernae TaxID=2045107 RepID=A0A917YYP5_9ACTN|nr:arginase family protein [Nonomuraea cavernae]MCA2185960.1 arginase family protein [Nonomuraea cavernae]GGO69109.1 arginase [Nonomuraea cavernae]
MSIVTTDRRLAVLDAPSNLGLRPPADGAAPGCYKAPWALRDAGLLERIGASDAGAVVPPRYVATWQPGDGVRNGPAIARYTRKLAERVAEIREAGRFPVVLGGDCSILLGSALALRRTGRYGLAYLDAHSDFRHLGNSPHVGSAAGEDLALATGRGDDYLTDLDGLRPYVRDEDVIVLGVRDEEDLRDFVDTGIAHVTDPELGGLEAARKVLVRDDLDGFWIHVDADVLDSSVLTAVDSPTPGGLDAAGLGSLLRGLLGLPGAAGLQITIYDPDLDEDGAQAALLVDILAEALAA